MSRTLIFAIGLLLIAGNLADAQRAQREQRKGKRGQDGRTARQTQDPIGDSNPLAIGDSGVAWYSTWDTGLTEAKRTNRPIFFMSAATTCSGVSGVF